MPIGERVEARVRKEFDEISKATGGKLAELLDGATDRIDDEIHESIAEVIGRDPGEALNDLRTFLNKARETLDEIAKGIEQTNLDLIAGEVAWSLGAGRSADTSFSAVIEEAGAEFCRGVIWRPSTGAGRLIDHEIDPDLPPLQGVTALEATDAESRRRVRGRSWNVGLIDTPVFDDSLVGAGGKRRTFAEAGVERTLSGVSVGTESWNRIRQDTDFFFHEGAGRAVEFADALSFVNAGEEEAPIFTGRLSLAYTWEEPRFGPREMKRFTRTFELCGLLGEEGAEALVGLRAEAKRKLGVSKPKASLRALLSVPPDHAVQVIDFVSSNRAAARDIVKRIVAAAPFNEKTFEGDRVDALLGYFIWLKTAQEAMRDLPKEATERERNALRDRLATDSRLAQKESRKHDWIELRSIFGIPLGKPPLRLMALFACLSDLVAATPGSSNPGMIYGFTAKDQPTRFVVSPGQGGTSVSASRLAALKLEEEADDA